MALKITGTNTAAAPGITGDDTDTGLFYASDVLGFSTGGTERLRIAASGQIGIAGTNYGSSGQVLTSAGSGGSVTWSTPSSGPSLANDANNRVITGTGSGLNGEANLTFDGSTLLITGIAKLAAGNQLMLDNGFNNRVAEIVNAGSSGNSNIVFKTNASERLRIRSDGNVAINSAGTASNILDVRKDATSVKIHLGSLNGQLSSMPNSSEYSLTFVGGNAELGLHKDGSGNLQYVLGTYQGSVDIPLVFRTGNRVERLRIDSSGRVLIGTTSTSPANSYSDNLVVRESAADAGISIIGNNSNSNYASLYLSDTSTASRGYLESQLGTNGTFTIGHDAGTGPIRFANGGAERFRIESDGNVKINDGNLIIGTAGHGIDFSATSHSSTSGDGEVLTTYEEGTWTPQPMFGGANTGMTYTNRSGTYVRVGKMVTAYYQIVFTSKGSSTGNFQIGGFPWANSQTEMVNNNFGYFHRFIFGADSTYMITCNLSGTTSGWRYAVHGTSSSGINMAAVTNAHVSSGTHVSGALVYRTP